MVKKRISIKGEKIHDVGYRLLLMNLAADLGIENFNAKNVKKDGKEAVEVLIDASGENVSKFFDLVNEEENQPEHAKVDSVDIGDYDGWVGTLDSFRSGFMAFQQQKFAVAGVGLLNVQEGMLTEMKGLKNEMHEFRKESGEKQDQMLDKQDSTIDKIDDMHHDLAGRFDTLRGDYGVIYKTIVEMLDEMRKERKESNERTEKLVKAILQSKKG
ncbi:MAG: hypothetical protein A7316_02250 [Candidatus Altiarchaeales archaeon WOR_SM1_86-2]|nr:MAG: hypothetical protein A7316_02250 [Candidatus Altiarchaeales archaeon WOR_SM1_86-2]